MTQSIQSSHPLIWLITGGSSGLGLSLVKRVLARGDFVIAPVRDPRKLFSQLPVEDKTSVPASSPLTERLHVLKFDMADSFEVMKEKVNESVKVWGRIDVLVNNAAQLMLGTLEEGGSEAMQQLFSVNLFGVMNMTNAVLPHMRERKSGTIVMVGSRSAFRNEVYGLGFYAASKAALHSYGETLSAELKPFGIRVLVLILGSFRTPAFSEMAMCFTPVVNTTGGVPIQDYADAHQIMRNLFSPETTNFTGKGDPDRGMDVLVDVVKREGRVKTLEGRGTEEQGGDETVEWPTWLFLGKDGMEAARKRLGSMSEVIEIWEKVGSDVEFEASDAS